ncbi:hypothetical protein H0H93_006771 [Arthromyces matolae]|nr:hypothetical protein H0H93_006771 [Arthromyces matolae]
MAATCFSSRADKEIAYAGICNEIAALQASIRACKRRHNDLNITARLPDEILADIFHWNYSIDRKYPKADFRKRVKRSWFQVSFVCSEWLRVVVNFAALWIIHDYKESGKWLSKNVENLDVGVCKIVVDIFQHMAPTLKNLSLYHSSLHLQPHLPLSLPIKSLSLVSVSIESFTHLVALLKACEKVEQLTFNTILLSREEDFEAPIEPSVVLPNLKSLTIMGDSCTERHMAAILSTMSFPVLTRIEIRNNAFEISSELLRAAARFIHPAKFLSIASGLLLSFSGISTLSPSGQWSIPQNHLTLSIQGSSNETFVSTFCQKLSDTSTLDSLEILEISTQYAPSTLLEVLGDLRYIHTLNIVGDFRLPIYLVSGLLFSEFYYWYEHVKKLWLKPQVADIDVQDKELSKRER